MVGEIFVGIITVVFFIVVWGVMGVGPIIAGFVLHDWIDEKQRYNYRTSRVAQYSWLIYTAYWIAMVLYYALYVAIFVTLYGAPMGDVQ